MVALAVCQISTTFAAERSGPRFNADLGVISEDNILRTTKADAISDQYLLLAPHAEYLSLFGEHRFSARYDGGYALFMDNDALNYENHALSADLELQHTKRLLTEYGAAYEHVIENPGESDDLATDGFVHTREARGYLGTSYGTNASKGQVRLRYDFNQLRYREESAEFRDRDMHRVLGGFYYRIAPKTRLLFEISNENLEYQNEGDFPSPSSSSQYYMTGAQWRLASKTQGSVRVGYLNRDYDDSFYNSVSALSYFADITWSPYSNTYVTITGSRNTSEAAIPGAGASLETEWAADITHALTGKTQLQFGYTIARNDFANIQRRSDKRNDIRAGVRHSIRRWLDLEFSVQHFDRDSNIARYDYKANRVALTCSTRFE